VGLRRKWKHRKDTEERGREMHEEGLVKKDGGRGRDK